MGGDDVNTRDLAIIGAGPIGLETAAGAVEAGLDVLVLEAGPVAAGLEAWGHVPLFTPFGMNAGPLGRARLEAAGLGLPEEDRILTAGAFRARYLLPLADSLRGALHLRTGSRVVSISRRGHLKTEGLGDTERERDSFRLLVESDGREEEIYAERVIDASGTYRHPNWAGPGGAPARGERRWRRTLDYGLPDVEGVRRDDFASARTLVIGAGHSAATTVLALTRLARDAPHTRFVWATRTPRSAPLSPIPDDPLPERARLVERANRVALRPPEGSVRLAGVQLVEIDRHGEEFRAGFERIADGTRVDIPVDRVVANVGFSPDRDLYRELQVHECYASAGPMSLSAALLGAAGAGEVDCLKVGGFGPDVLRTPEPGFFIIGIKSYGRNPGFLLRTGYEQARDVLTLLGTGPYMRL